ncbi:MAG TPA: extracellular solute-binding protein, partial [Ardenticatenaceae bacterium]
MAHTAPRAGKVALALLLILLLTACGSSVPQAPLPTLTSRPTQTALVQGQKSATEAPAPPAGSTDGPAAAPETATRVPTPPDPGAEQGAEEQTSEEVVVEEEPVEEVPAEEAPAGEGAGEMAGALPAECGTVALDYWNPFTGPDGPFMGQMVDAFNAENPNIQVMMTTQAEYYTQLGTAQASNTLPDVAIVHADQVATQAFRNIIRPIPEDIVAAMALDPADFPERVWNAGEVADARYAIPLDIHPMTMFYNADLVPEPPTNAEEFAAAADAATTEDTNGFMITTGFPVQQIFEMLVAQFGGSAFNEEGTEATWNSEAGVQALEWMLEAQERWSEANLEVDAELNAFRGGTVGMIWNGI